MRNATTLHTVTREPQAPFIRYRTLVSHRSTKTLMIGLRLAHARWPTEYISIQGFLLVVGENKDTSVEVMKCWAEGFADGVDYQSGFYVLPPS